MHSTSTAMESIDTALDALIGELSGGRVAEVHHDDLTALVTSARRAQARLESVVLSCVGEVDARGSHVHEGALTTGAWLRRHTRATGPEAATAVRCARVLRSGVLPATAQALADGEISARHAQTIADGAQDAPAEAVALIEEEALAVAREADVQAVTSVMRRFRHALDPDAADEAAVRRYERRGISFSPLLDGMVSIGGLADEVSGSVLSTAVDLAAPLEPGDTRTAAARRLDGLVAICRRFLQSPDAPRQGGGAHAHLIVTVDEETLRTRAAHAARSAGPQRAGSSRGARPTDGARPADDAERAARTAADGWGGSPGGTLSWVGQIAGSTARRLACDAQATRVTIGPDGEVVETHSERRFFTAAQRRAMIARDGDRCIWPYCDRPVSWSDGHHLDGWADGGPTTVGNGGLPCEGHHISLHEGGWRIDRLADGRYVAHHRNGRVLGPEPHPPGRNRPIPKPRSAPDRSPGPDERASARTGSPGPRRE